METILYSAEWTGDKALGEAIINMLCEELKKRGIDFRLEYTEGFTDSTDIIPQRIGLPEKFQCILVEEGTLSQATEALDHILRERGREVKEEALRVAKVKGYITNEEEFDEYREGLSDTYGW